MKERCIGWNQLSPVSLGEDYPNSTVLRAWTTPPQQGANYYLLFGGEDQLDNNAISFSVDHIAQLGTDEANSGAVVLTVLAGLKSLYCNVRQ